MSCWQQVAELVFQTGYKFTVVKQAVASLTELFVLLTCENIREVS